MKVFVSSLMGGFEEYREAAFRAVKALDCDLLRAEEWGARTDTPRQACLEEAREADVTLLILGERYGEPLASGLSATHEEYREARDRRTVLAFVQQGVSPDPRQQELISEVRDWSGGGITASFRDADDLRDKVANGLNRHMLRQATGRVDEAELHERAVGLLPGDERGSVRDSALHVVVAGGPRHQVIRPAQLDEATLGVKLHQHALFGPHKVLDPAQGATPTVSGSRLVVSQSDRAVELHDDGSVRITAPALVAPADRGYSMPVIIEEDVRSKVLDALGFAGWVLDEVDPLHRLSDVTVVAAIAGAPSGEWRTQAQHEASGSSMTVGLGRPETILAPQSPTRHPRGVLTADAEVVAADLVTLLRRQFK